MSEYNEFINQILDSRPNMKFEGSECHHIKPRCLGGTWDDGYVYLTYAEHYKAHQLLLKEDPDNPKLAYALLCMSNFNLEKSPEEFEEDKRLALETLSKHSSGKLNHFYGKEHTEETKRILSEYASNRVGALNPHYGKEQTPLNKLAVVESNKRRKGFKKINNGVINKQVSPEELNIYLENGWSLGTITSCTCKVCGREFKGKGTNKYCSDCYKYSRRGKRLKYDNQI